MKKILLALVGVTVVLAGAMGTFASSGYSNNTNKNYNSACVNFIDKNGDCVCDNRTKTHCNEKRRANFVDKNNDGICDNFLDKDSNGICDNRNEYCDNHNGYGRHHKRNC